MMRAGGADFFLVAISNPDMGIELQAVSPKVDFTTMS
jgi:hypothetical protein